MRKTLLMSIAVASALATFVAPTMAGKAEKVSLCHIIAANDEVPFLGGNTLLFGKEISVSGNALNAHLEHGDLDCFWGGADASAPIDTFREAGAHLPAANCYIRVNGAGELHGPAECDD